MPILLFFFGIHIQKIRQDYSIVCVVFVGNQNYHMINNSKPFGNLAKRVQLSVYYSVLLQGTASQCLLGIKFFRPDVLLKKSGTLGDS